MTPSSSGSRSAFDSLTRYLDNYIMRDDQVIDSEPSPSMSTSNNNTITINGVKYVKADIAEQSVKTENLDTCHPVTTTNIAETSSTHMSLRFGPSIPEVAAQAISESSSPAAGMPCNDEESMFVRDENDLSSVQSGMSEDRNSTSGTIDTGGLDEQPIQLILTPSQTVLYLHKEILHHVLTANQAGDCLDNPNCATITLEEEDVTAFMRMVRLVYSQTLGDMQNHRGDYNFVLRDGKGQLYAMVHKYGVFHILQWIIDAWSDECANLQDLLPEAKKVYSAEAADQQFCDFFKSALKNILHDCAKSPELNVINGLLLEDEVHVYISQIVAGSDTMTADVLKVLLEMSKVSSEGQRTDDNDDDKSYNARVKAATDNTSFDMKIVEPFCSYCHYSFFTCGGCSCYTEFYHWVDCAKDCVSDPDWMPKLRCDGCLSSNGHYCQSPNDCRGRVDKNDNKASLTKDNLHHTVYNHDGLPQKRCHEHHYPDGFCKDLCEHVSSGHWACADGCHLPVPQEQDIAETSATRPFTAGPGGLSDSTVYDPTILVQQNWDYGDIPGFFQDYLASSMTVTAIKPSSPVDCGMKFKTGDVITDVDANPRFIKSANGVKVCMLAWNGSTHRHFPAEYVRINALSQTSNTEGL